MKKLFILLGILAFVGGASYAYYYENETLEPVTLQGEGYSDSLIKVTDKVHEFNEGVNGKYKRHYQNKKGAYSTLKQYVDPAQDDGLFAEHQINFSNTWNFNRTKYATPEKPANNSVENL